MSAGKKIFTANRIAAIASFLAGLAGLLTGLGDAFEGTEIGNAIVAAIGLLTILGTAVKFLAGAQKWDKLTAPAPIDLQMLAAESNYPETQVEEDGDEEPDGEGRGRSDGKSGKKSLFR